MKVSFVAVTGAPPTVIVLVTVNFLPSPTVPGTAASSMQLVSSVNAPSSVSIQQIPVALLNQSPSGDENEFLAVRPDRLTSAGWSSSEPNRKISQPNEVEVEVEVDVLSVSLNRMI